MHSSLNQDIGKAALSESFATGEQEQTLPDAKREELSGLKKSIKQLKSIMLTLEWDLSSQALQELDEEIVAQETKWQEDKNVAGLLRILRALGKYIGRMQARTHPVAIKLFFAVYNGLEKIVLTPDMAIGKKKKIVLLAYQRYTEVKDKLEKREQLLKKAQQATARQSISAQKIAPLSSGETPTEGTSEETEKPEEGEGIVPALSDISFSEDDIQRRSSWYEKDEPTEVESRLDAFFVDEESDATPSGTVEQEPGKENIIDSLFAAEETGEADQVLTEMHLSVFDKGEQKEMPSPPALKQEGDRYESGPAFDQEIAKKLDTFFEDSDDAGEVVEESPPTVCGLSSQPEEAATAPEEQDKFSAEISGKLDAFFDESGDTGEIGDIEKEASEPIIQKVAVIESAGGQKDGEEFAAGIESKLDSFFDEEDEAISLGGEIPLPQPEQDEEVGRSADLEELLVHLVEVTDDFQHPPAAGEKIGLEQRFIAVENSLSDSSLTNIRLLLLRFALYSCQDKQDELASFFLKCAAEACRMQRQALEAKEGEGDRVNEIPGLLKDFLALKERQLDALRGTGQPAAGSKESGEDVDDFSQWGKEKKQSSSSWQDKGDMIIEDLFSDDT